MARYPRGIRPVKDKNGKIVSYQYRYRIDGVEKAENFKTLTAARARKAQVEDSKRRGAYIDLKNKTTVQEFARRWVESRPYKVNSTRSRESFLRRSLEDTPLGRKRIVDVRPLDVQEWITDLVARGRQPVTVRGYRDLLAAIFHAAIAEGIITTSPVVRRGLTLPEVHRETLVLPTMEQVRLLAEYMGIRHIPGPKPKIPRSGPQGEPRFRAAILAQAGLGLRQSELLGLRKQDVDFLGRGPSGRSVRIDLQLEAGSARRDAPKSRAGRRTIPMPQMVADALAAHMAQYRPLARVSRLA